MVRELKGTTMTRAGDLAGMSMRPGAMRAILGGRWPDLSGTEWEGFSFEAVDRWVLERDGTWTPTDGSEPVPGPNVRVVAELAGW